MKKVSINNLQISEDLFKFVNEEAIPGTNLESNKFLNTNVNFHKVVLL